MQKRCLGAGLLVALTCFASRDTSAPNSVPALQCRVGPGDTGSRSRHQVQRVHHDGNSGSGP